mgnify:CR=1 FL=1
MNPEVISLRAQLLRWLVAPLVTLNLIAAGIAYWLAWIPAQTAFDQSLADTAWALVPHVQGSGPSIELSLSQQAEQVLRVDHFDSIFFVVRDVNGGIIAGDLDFPPLQAPAKPNTYVAYSSRMRDQEVRAITLSTIVNGEPILIGVAETRVKRQQLKLRIFWSLLITELLLLLLVILVVRWVLDKGFKPLQEIQGELAARRPDDLSPLPLASTPQEIAPFIRAINDLLHRAQESASAKQAFLANVAHQLRTPLAGFKAQLEWLREHHRHDQDTAHSADLMLASTDRMVRQANQLLTLARSEPGDFQRQRLSRVSLDQLVSASVQQFVQQALKKNIDIGFNLQPTEVHGDNFLLRDLVDNLVDNAIRYTPPGGQVTVSCAQINGHGVLRVEDNGPGIPETEKEHVFERFYRLDQMQAGSGLGLAIVRDIATDHHAIVSLTDATGGRGTVVSVEFPPLSAEI